MQSAELKTPRDILDFWFSEPAKSHWFQSTDAFDAHIRHNFEPTAIHLASDFFTAGAARWWEGEGPEAHLALIIALDQFPRNMYRGTPAAFAWDGRILASAERLLDRAGDLKLNQTQRPFAYMPFMHSERLADQERCVELCDQRLEDDNTLKFAIMHRDIIARFGRFPHRNVILGRETTAAEQQFLDDGGFSG